MQAIRVFRPGKGSLVMMSLENAVWQKTLQRQGGGIFFDRVFDSMPAAEAFSNEMLSRDRSLVLHIFDGDQIVQTVMDIEMQRELGRRREHRIKVTTSALIVAASVILDCMFFRNLPVIALAAIPLGIFGIYFLLLRSFRVHSLEASIQIFILIILLFTSLLIWARKQHHHASHNSPAYVKPATERSP